MDFDRVRARIAVRLAQRAKVQRALAQYVGHLSRASHFAFHPLPRPTDAAAASEHFDAAVSMEPDLWTFLTELIADEQDEEGHAEAYSHGLMFGIGALLEPTFASTEAQDEALDDRYARRSGILAIAERYRRLLARAETLVNHPEPLQTDAEAAVGQLAAVQHAERLLLREFNALTK